MNPSEAGKKGYEKSRDALRKHLDERTQRVINEYESDPKFCLFCGEKIPFEKRRGKFCNSACAASHNNRGVNRHSETTKANSFCDCGKPKLPHNKYCPDCIKKRVYNVIPFEDMRQDRSRRKRLLEIRGHQCEVCGLSEWMGNPIPLELDHIDGNSDNNSVKNLRLICPNCHAQTETYKGANAGKNSSRQVMRRRRYSDGKTY